MNIKEQLTEAMKTAMRAGDTVSRTTLRMALSSIKYAEVQNGGELTDPDVLGILQKEIKSRQDTIADAEKSNRNDLLEAALAEIDILQAFLPKQLTETELEALIKETMIETGAASPRDMGNLMKALMPKLKGRADGKLVSGMVQKLLQG